MPLVETACSLPKRLCRERRAAQAHASARVLPKLFSFVQLPDGASNGDEIVFGESLSNIGVVQRRLVDRDRDLIGERGDHRLVAWFGRRILFAVNVIVDLGRLGISVGDALIVFARDVFGNGGIDADLGAGRHDPIALRQARIERLRPCV